MLTLVPEPIEAYALRHSDPEPPLLAELAEETRKHTTLPQMMVGPLEGAVLRLLAGLIGARRVLELGTFTGYSALWLASALPEGGKVVTCDVDPAYAAIAQRFWKRSPHGGKIELKLGPALESLKTLEGPFDLVFVDADKTNYPAYWDAVLPKIRKGGLLVVDNVLWSGRVLEPKDDEDRAIAELARKASADRRVERTLLTVRDGMLVARVL